LMRNRLLAILLSGLPLVVAIALFIGLLALAGAPPLSTLGSVLRGGFGTTLGIRETLIRATPILLCSLAVAVPARAGLFNIGGEGQLYLGAIGATAVALHAPGLPAAAVLPVMLLAAALAGALLAAIPAILKAVWGVNEILVALMLNYVALYAVEYLVHGPWRDPSAMGWPYSAPFPAPAILPTWGSTNIHLGLLLGLLAILLLAAIFHWTTFGFAVRVIKASPDTARYSMTNVARLVVLTMVLGGALAALAGAGEASVIQGRLRPGMSSGYGYVGFLVSWLSGHRFPRLIVAAILVGGLYTGADELQLTSRLPSATADILLGLAFAGSICGGWARRRASARRGEAT
jgi:general nucleoside transport system permease protein